MTFKEIKNELTEEQKIELEKAAAEIEAEATRMKLDYEQNPSNLDSGSVVVVHQDSTLLNNKDEKLSDVAFSIKRKSSSINEYGDDEWATPSKENKK